MIYVGRLAQRLERSVYTRKVVRSNRTVPTIRELHRFTFSGDVVQLVRTLPCHGRGREFESRRPRHFLFIGEVVSQFLTFARALVPSVLSKLKVPPQQSIILRDRACWLKTLRPDSIMLSEIHCRIMGRV